MRFAGYDPGSITGAGVVLSGGVVRCWIVWTRLGRGAYRVRIKGEGFDTNTVQMSSMHRVARFASEWLPTNLIAVEGLYVANRNTAKSKAQRRSLLPLAESAGELIGPLRGATHYPILRPIAQTQWRPDVLHLRHTATASQAGAAAIRHARRAYCWPEDPGALYSAGQLTRAELEALCESACIAEWASRQDIPCTD